MSSAPAPIGIHDIAFATTSLKLDLAAVAERLGVDAQKYYVGIGQNEMSLPARDEDVVTMAAAAAKQIVDRHGVDGIRTVLFATETGIDQSKAAGVYVHRLLGLPANARVVELKQACYSATAAVQFALGLVQRDPRQKVLVIASDVARYEIGSTGEPTQGAAAVAMLVAAEPSILAIEPAAGLFTSDVMDFWRPNHLRTALVDGKYSIRAYLTAVEGAWNDYRAQGGHDFAAFDRFCYHQPFTKMATKAHRHLAKIAGALAPVTDGGLGLDQAALDAQISSSVIYNRNVGNSYTASIYLAFLALLDHEQELDGARIGFLSYGSGSVSEFFAGVLQPGYAAQLRTASNRAAIEGRRALADDDYLARRAETDPVDGGDHRFPFETTGPFRLAGISADERLYEVAEAPADAVDTPEPSDAPASEPIG